MAGNNLDNVAILTSNAADPADSGFIRMGNAETIVWEANTPGVDITLQVNTDDNFEFSGTWPNYFKNNLQFYYGKDVVCILPVEEY